MGLHQLWQRIVCRENSFEALLEPHVGYLYRLAYRFCGNQDDAEDLVQDLLTKLYARSTDELTQLDQLRPWLARVLYRMYVDRCRSQARSPVLQPGSEAELEQQLHPAPGPEQEAESEAVQARLARALQSLNPDQQAVVLLHDIEGYTLNELQYILEVPLGTLKSRLNRAHGYLRQQLETEQKTVEPFPTHQRLIG